MQVPKFRSIFTAASKQERTKNFENYWLFSQHHSGELLEDDKDLVEKRAKFQFFQDNPVQLRTPLVNPKAFYRNYVAMQDYPKTLENMTLMLTGM